ncbi:hypothetical protein MTO96_039657 [Rhipicephalus appendiculatus]
MGPRKQYLGPINSGPGLPKSTRTYLQRCAFARGTNDNQSSIDAVPAAAPDVPCGDGGYVDNVDNVDAEEMPEDDSCGPETNAATSEEPVQSGSEQSAQDLLLMVLNFALEFGLSWKAVEALQRLIVHILDRHDVPTSKYMFKKQVGASIRDARFHFYCAPCMNSLGETSGDLQQRNNFQASCSTCHKSYSGRTLVLDGNFFITLPIVQQLSSLLCDQGVTNALVKKLQSIKDQDRARDRLADVSEVGDITDGSMYQELRQELEAGDLTITFNADGSPVFKSSKFSILPIQISLNELPPQLRCKNIIVSALWHGQSHPDMVLLLESFVQQFSDINANLGVTWMAGTRAMHSKVYCLSCCADAPARAVLQNFTQYNGYYGCGWCLHEGKTVDGEQSL